SYFRKIYVNILGFLPPCQGWKYLFLLGKVVLYQLSYFRKIYVNILGFLPPCQGWKYLFLLGKVVLYQLSYFRKKFNLNNQYLSIASAKVHKKN
ncbi:MAG: hypothetical protein IJA24_08840, partial [Alistipes sp.]|nr:hypothetical protein [Alistipes sp.]